MNIKRQLSRALIAMLISASALNAGDSPVETADAVQFLNECAIAPSNAPTFLRVKGVTEEWQGNREDGIEQRVRRVYTTTFETWPSRRVREDVFREHAKLEKGQWSTNAFDQTFLCDGARWWKLERASSNVAGRMTPTRRARVTVQESPGGYMDNGAYNARCADFRFLEFNQGGIMDAVAGAESFLIRDRSMAISRLDGLLRFSLTHSYGSIKARRSLEMEFDTKLPGVRCVRKGVVGERPFTSYKSVIAFEKFETVKGSRVRLPGTIVYEMWSDRGGGAMAPNVLMTNKIESIEFVEDGGESLRAPVLEPGWLVEDAEKGLVFRVGKQPDSVAEEIVRGLAK